MSLSASNYTKLKTNLKLASDRLEVFEKEKIDSGLKFRKESADSLAASKIAHAKTCVEHVVSEENLVEASQIVKSYCDVLLDQFSSVQQLKALNGDLAEPITSLIWVAPKLQLDVKELKIVADLLAQKFGKQSAQARENTLNLVSEKLVDKWSYKPLPKIIVDEYLVGEFTLEEERYLTNY